jgi:Spy/CpxP family protein refolding chaperone
MIEKVIKDLDLNDGQKKEMDIIHEEIKAKMESNKQNRDNDFNEFANLFKQDKLDKAQLTALADKHEGNREEMKSFFMDELIKVHDVLTADQRSKAVDKMKEMKEKFHNKNRDKRPPENH